MKSNNFLVGSFLIGIGLIIGLAMMFLNLCLNSKRIETKTFVVQKIVS